jgi:hypothetical protein
MDITSVVPIASSPQLDDLLRRCNAMQGHQINKFLLAWALVRELLVTEDFTAHTLGHTPQRFGDGWRQEKHSSRTAIRINSYPMLQRR